MKKARDMGYSLLQLLVFTMVLIPILLAIASTGGVVGSTVSTLEGRATAAEVCQITQQRVARLLRPLSISSIEILVDEDYLKALGAKYPPATPTSAGGDSGSVGESGGESGDDASEGSSESFINVVTTVIPDPSGVENLLYGDAEAIPPRDLALLLPEGGSNENYQGYGPGAEPLNAPSLGSWVAPLGGLPFRTLRFDSAAKSGNFSSFKSGATLTAGTLQLEFVLDPDEIENGEDDDGDGLIDEGSLVMIEGKEGERHILASGLEECRFRLVGRSMIVVLRSARVDRQGIVHRTESLQIVYLRGN